MIKVDNISKSYGGHVALSPTSREFASGTTTVLIGPSGCGKSTLLRTIVGLVTPNAGTVTVAGEVLTPANVLNLRRKIGYMIQDGGLFPHLTAEGNATLLARFVDMPEAAIKAHLDELCALTRISIEMMSRYPAELSGGQRQRVALIRALMLDPEILLLDEPLGALDPITRYELQSELKEIFGRLKKTVVLVTHDLAEAAFLGDEIVLMQDGKIVQAGTIDQMRKSPSQPYVTEFLRAQHAPQIDQGGATA